MNLKNLAVTLVFALFLVFFLASTSITEDDPSKSLKGTVVCIDKEGKECCDTPECCPTCCDKSDKPCNYSLKISSGKVYPFAVKSKSDKVVNFKDYAGKQVEVSGYVCPVSKSVQYSDVKLQCSKTAKTEDCCSKSQTTTVKSK